MKITRLGSLKNVCTKYSKNSSRLFSFKFDMAPAYRQSDQPEDPPKSTAEESPKPSSTPFRYNLYQPRTAPSERPNINDLQKRSARTYAEEHAQASGFGSGTGLEEEVPTVPTVQNQRKFLVSKTYANATLPLKSVKLASPFPEPVKMMMSRTVSDYEKAEQMLADAKCQLNLSASCNKPQNFRSFSTGMRRWYSKSANKDRKKPSISYPKRENLPKKIDLLHQRVPKKMCEVFLNL